MTGHEIVPPPFRNARRVLVIDDEADLLTMLGSGLPEFGVLMTGCQSAAEALHRCVIDEFPYIVADYEMPGMNGIELTRQLRKLFPRSVIIGMSASDRSIEFLHAGANDFLKKPFEIGRLARMITCESTGH